MFSFCSILGVRRRFQVDISIISTRWIIAVIYVAQSSRKYGIMKTCLVSADFRFITNELTFYVWEFFCTNFTLELLHAESYRAAYLRQLLSEFNIHIRTGKCVSPAYNTAAIMYIFLLLDSGLVVRHSPVKRFCQPLGERVSDTMCK